MRRNKPQDLQGGGKGKTHVVQGASAVGYPEEGVTAVYRNRKDFHRAYPARYLTSKEGWQALKTVRVVEAYDDKSLRYRLNPLVKKGATAEIPRSGFYVKLQRVGLVGALSGVVAFGVLPATVSTLRGDSSASASGGHLETDTGGAISLQPAPAPNPFIEAQPPQGVIGQPEQGQTARVTQLLGGKVVCTTISRVPVSQEAATRFKATPLTVATELTGENFRGLPTSLHAQAWSEIKALNNNTLPAAGAAYSLPDACTFK